MPPRSIPPKGLYSLATLAGQARRHVDACHAYLRVGFLELDRSRRQHELLKAQRTVERVKARFAEIDAEKQAILQACGEPPSGTPPPPTVREIHGRREILTTIPIRY